MGGIVTVIRRQKQHPLWYHTFLFWVSSLSHRCRSKRQVVTGILRPCLSRLIQIQDVCALRVAKGSDSVLAVRERFRIFPQPSKLLTALMWCLGWPMGWPRFYGRWPWPPPATPWLHHWSPDELYSPWKSAAAQTQQEVCRLMLKRWTQVK